LRRRTGYDRPRRTPRERAPSPLWEHKVGILSYNPGERLNDEQRRALYERTLNEQAREGWELVGSVLNRDTVRTVGGAVTVRESTSFVPTAEEIAVGA
jgi:hypothetical protein